MLSTVWSAQDGASVVVLVACSVCAVTVASADAPRADERPSVSGRALYAVATRGGRVIAVGDAGVVLEYHAKRATWSRHKVPTAVAVRAVSLVGTRVAWTAGVGGQTMRFDGRAWVSPPGGTGRNFYGIAMLAPNVGVIVGAGGRVYARAGERWDRVRLGVSGHQTLRAVVPLGRGPRASFLAVGDGGTALWVSGAKQFARARKENTGVAGSLLAVAACPGRHGDAVAAGDAVIVRSRRGRWRALPAPPSRARGVVVRCRRGRVREVVVAGAGVWHFVIGSAAWRPLMVTPRAGLNGLAWLDEQRVVVVGAAGFRAIVDTRADQSLR